MELIIIYICKEFDIGIYNNMFGGCIMFLIDDVVDFMFCSCVIYCVWL